MEDVHCIFKTHLYAGLDLKAEIDFELGISVYIQIWMIIFSYFKNFKFQSRYLSEISESCRPSCDKSVDTSETNSAEYCESKLS